jgi:hypothetical protein
VSTPSVRVLATTLAGAALFLAACGDATPDRRGTPADTPGDGASAETRPGAAAIPSTAGSGITADVDLEDLGDRVSVRVTLHGLVPDERYPVNVHADGCDARGAVRLPMGRVTGGEDGTGSVRMTVARDRLPDGPFAIRAQDPDGTPVACAQVDPEPRDAP